MAGKDSSSVIAYKLKSRIAGCMCEMKMACFNTAGVSYLLCTFKHSTYKDACPPPPRSPT